MTILVTKNDGTQDVIEISETNMPAEEIAVAIEQMLENMGMCYCDNCDMFQMDWSSDHDMCKICAKIRN